MGGQETTAVSMMFPMLHHGMIIVGVPYSVPELIGSGSPYGPSRIVGSLSTKKIEEADIKWHRHSEKEWQKYPENYRLSERFLCKNNINFQILIAS
jgi:multimeric flavodoxin WrbA